jgi:hypothetical protein
MRRKDAPRQSRNSGLNECPLSFGWHTLVNWCRVDAQAAVRRILTTSIDGFGAESSPSRVPQKNRPLRGGAIRGRSARVSGRSCAR